MIYFLNQAFLILHPKSYKLGKEVVNTSLLEVTENMLNFKSRLKRCYFILSFQP